MSKAMQPLKRDWHAPGHPKGIKQQAASRHSTQTVPTSALTGCLSSEVCTSLPSVSSMMATEYLQTVPSYEAHLDWGQLL